MKRDLGADVGADWAGKEEGCLFGVCGGKDGCVESVFDNLAGTAILWECLSCRLTEKLFPPIKRH